MGNVFAEAKQTGGKGKILFLRDIDEPSMVDTEKTAISELAKKGYDEKNYEFIYLRMNGQTSKAKELLAKIKESKPDIIISLVTGYNQAILLAPLLGTATPIIQYQGMDLFGFMDEKGYPKSNIAGLTLFPKGIEESAVKLLNKLYPINGKKVVTLNVDRGLGVLVDAGLKAQKIPIKESLMVLNVEDYQAAIKKFNNDDEVGWIVCVATPVKKKDGSPMMRSELNKWTIENNKKPTYTFWEGYVVGGSLCGAAVNSPQTGIQLADMASRVLKGENIKSIKTEEPKKVNILINKKIADKLGIQIPPDLLGGVWRIYTDLEGHYVGQN